MKPIRFLTLIAIFFLVSEVQAQKIQLLTNPTFEDGTNGWWYYGTDVTTANGEVNFDVTNPGTNPWDVQLGQGNFTLKTGYKYTLTWRAKRESEDLAFILALGEEPYTSFIYDKREGLNGTWQESSMEYTHTEANISNIGVTVQMGGSNANVTIDYISLTEEPVVSEDYNQYFTNYNSFITKLTNLTSSADSATALDVFWSNLVASGKFPFAIGNKVAFLYRGSASSVSWKGGFNEWNANADPGVRLGVSNIWLMEKELPSDARSGYKIVTNGNDGIADPHNPYPVSVEWGNSDLRMPDYEIPFETIVRPSIPKGTLSENILKYSSNLKYNCQYKVYTPAGYNELSNLPVMFVTDGHDFSDDDKGQLKIILDNLIHDKEIQPLIAVFLDPRDPNDLSRNRRSDEYRNNINFVKYVTQELIPDIDAAYKTNASPHARAIAGYSYGGYNAAYFCAHATEYIKKTAILSPIMHPNPPSEGYQIDGDMMAADLTESKIFMSYGVFDTREIVFFKQLMNLFIQKDKEFLGLGVNDGHSYSNWSGMIVKGLKYLFGPEKNKVKITFQVDMKDQTVSGDGVFINGNFSNWQTPIKMQANGTTYFVKLLLDEGALIEYKFMNGNTIENIPGNCTNGDYKNRYLTVPESDNVVNTVCFNSCSSCTVSSVLDTNPGVGPVSYYGEMQTSGNRIIGERTQQPMQVKGISFFWSIWGGEKFWTPGAVNALVDDWDVELIRAPMSVEEDDKWGTEKGYLNPLGKQTQIENMERMVQAAIERDIYVIIDFHSHEAHLHTEEAKEFFGYMAQKYGSYDNVIFEIYNEPIDADWPTIKAYAEAVIESIREYSDNLVIVGTEFYSQRVDNASMSPINDINTAYVFHFYASHGEELRQIVRTALNNNIPLFASEWGSINVWGDNINRTDAAGFKNSDDWHEFMDENMISSANWAVFAENKLNSNSTCLHKLGINELSKTGENWNDTSIMTESGKYVYNMLKEQAKVAPWRKAENTTTVQVTFSVNINDEATSTGGVFLEGSFNNWESKVQMTANESVYSVTLEIPVGEYVEYRFRNGNTLEEGVGGDCFGWDNNRLVIVPKTDISLDADCFNTCSQCIVIETYNIEAFSSPVEGGIVSGSGEYNEGTDVTLTATPNEGYEFVNWTKNGDETSENQTFTVSATEDLNLQANFKLIPSFVVDAVSLPANGGKVEGTGTFNEGTEITLTAISNEGYEFIGWTDNGVEISVESSVSLNVSENKNLQANFKLLTGIERMEFSEENIQVFPNPTTGQIVLNGLPENRNLTIRIYNAKGKMLVNKSIENTVSTELNLDDYKSGMYYLVIKGKDFQKTLDVIKISNN